MGFPAVPADLDDRRRAAGVPALALALVTPGEVRLCVGSGHLSHGGAVTAQTPFMLGSVSKVVTGTLLMHLVESGDLDLDEDVSRWLPFRVEGPPSLPPITLRGLASHQSGLRDANPEYASPYGVGDSPQSLADFLRSYLTAGGEHHDAQRNFGAAGAYSYSNVGVALAAFVAECRLGRPFDRLCRERVFGPLSMPQTGWFLRDFPDPGDLAQPHDPAGRALPHYGYPTYPDGQLRSSAGDMARFLAAVMNGGELGGVRILQPGTVEQMLGVQASRPGEDQLLFWTRKQGLTGHLGGDDGVLSFLYFHPGLRRGLVLLMNSQTPASVELGRRLVRELLLHD